jgi:hypothetical protein
MNAKRQSDFPPGTKKTVDDLKKAIEDTKGDMFSTTATARWNKVWKIYKHIALNNTKSEAARAMKAITEASDKPSAPKGKKRRIVVKRKPASAAKESAVETKEEIEVEDGTQTVSSTPSDYQSKTRDVIDTSTDPERVLMEREEQGVTNDGVGKEDVVDLKDIKTDHPTAKAVINGDVEALKKAHMNPKSGKVSASKLKKSIAEGREEVPFEVRSQYDYEADKLIKEATKRADKTGGIEWSDEDVAGMATGKKGDTQYMITTSSSGKGYSIWKKEKGGKFQEVDKRFRFKSIR